MDLQNLSIEELTALVTEKSTAAAALLEGTLTVANVEKAETLSTEAAAARGEIARREAEQADVAARAAAVTAALAEDAEEAPESEEAAEAVEADAEEPVEAEATEPVEAADEAPAAPVAAKTSRVAALAAKGTPRPVAPKRQGRISITAAADVPDFGAGTNLGDIATTAQALISRTKAFGTPSGTVDEWLRTPEGIITGPNPDYVPNLSFSGVAKFNLEFPDDLKVERNSDALSVIAHATDESRLEGKSLVAAGGWCTPSENLYDLCEGETLDGLISVPEVQINRGGINFTKGPDFSSLYAAIGFTQTEAQAEAGTAKPCYELVCPDWTEVRLDAVGICIKVPILTNAAFPELTQRVVRGAMVVHQHKVNASVIARMVALAGAATASIDYTTTAQSLWANLTRVAYLKRQSYKLGLNESLEVILPAWVKDAIRDDLSLRTGRPLEEVTDAYIAREFAIRNLAPQWVYDWQELPATAATEGYPATVNVLMYPAGTYVKGVSDVINLSAVYDAASLAVNTYTGLFFEEGLLVANTCYDADLVTIPVCNSGRTGAADLVECGVDTTP